ncbi:MAG: class II aldolase/adducin family protein, partial [Pseudorhodoplanes sp.]
MKPDWAKQMSDREIDMRIDLAAAHRMAVIHGFSEGIFNHLTALVPGKPDRFLVIPFGMHWSEAQASTLLESDFERNVTAGVGKVESSAYYIHVPIHQARQDAPCVFHTHMP